MFIIDLSKGIDELCAQDNKEDKILSKIIIMEDSNTLFDNDDKMLQFV